MKKEEIKTKSNDDLKKLLQDEKEKLRQLRFDLAAGKVKNIREIRLMKKEVARILTKINKKEDDK